MIKLKAIIAINNYGFIGKENKLMWKSKDDIKHFKEITTGSVCIVGRTTYENDLKGKPLPNRSMVILGKGYVNSPLEAMLSAMLAAGKYEKGVYKQQKDIFIIGGLKVYETFKPFIDEWHISKINNVTIGDAHFPISNDIHEKAIYYYFDEDIEK